MVFCVVSAESHGFIIVGFLFAFIPLIIQFVTHVLMLCVVRNVRGSNRKNAIRAMKTVLLTVGTYFLCWVPTAVYFILNLLPNTKPASWFIFMTGEILLFNSGMGCIIYTASLPMFRTSLLRSCWKKQYNTQIHPSSGTLED